MTTLSLSNLSVLDSIEVMQIGDDEVDKVVKNDIGNGEFDDSYYTNSEHGSFDIIGDECIRHYKEWSNGYYLTLVKKTDGDEKSFPVTTAFIDLKYGHWEIREDYRKKAEFSADIVELSLESNKWLTENGFRGSTEG